MRGVHPPVVALLLGVLVLPLLVGATAPTHAIVILKRLA